MRYHEGRMSVLIAAGIHVLEILFIVGGAGSTVVLILTGNEDIKTLMGFDDPGPH